jgi:hypothetical protein
MCVLFFFSLLIFVILLVAERTENLKTAAIGIFGTALLYCATPNVKSVEYKSWPVFTIQIYKINESKTREIAEKYVPTDSLLTKKVRERLNAANEKPVSKQEN